MTEQQLQFDFMKDLKTKSCSNCVFPDGGVCQYAGEISSDYVCENWKQQTKEN